MYTRLSRFWKLKPQQPVRNITWRATPITLPKLSELPPAKPSDYVNDGINHYNRREYGKACGAFDTGLSMLLAQTELTEDDKISLVRIYTCKIKIFPSPESIEAGRKEIGKLLEQLEETSVKPRLG
jgi:hypothetical protein